jgi:hypothetical protein
MWISGTINSTPLNVLPVNGRALVPWVAPDLPSPDPDQAIDIVYGPDPDQAILLK